MDTAAYNKTTRRLLHKTVPTVEQRKYTITLEISVGPKTRQCRVLSPVLTVPQYDVDNANLSCIKVTVLLTDGSHAVTTCDVCFTLLVYQHGIYTLSQKCAILLQQ